MTRSRRVAGTLTVAAAATALAGLSALRWTAEPADHAVVRLTWRVRGVRVEDCRRLSAEEQANLPAHMRRDEICEGRVLPYRLDVTLDGRAVVRDTVRAAGARADRPLFVAREFPVDPGPHHLRVAFVRDRHDDDHDGEGEEEEAEHGSVSHDADRPERLLLDTTLTLAPGTITLVTYDAAARRLVLRRPDAP